MSFPLIILIMLTAGLFGGLVNFLLPANENPDTGKKIKLWWECLILGIGATIMIPLFLEIAQSNLLENISFNFAWEPEAGKEGVLAKDYLLYFSYCLVAAAAGFRFIYMLINNVVKDQQITRQKDKISVLQKEKEKRVKNSQLSQQKEEKEVHMELSRTAAPSALPTLPPISHPEDPQKGRFGGKAESNRRKLSAAVADSFVPGFYKVTLSVKATDASHPLDSDVVFYLHDSFNPSVYLIKPADFVGDVASVAGILSYGAFTVGAITDNGNTLLELDLAEDKSFPKEFRDR